MTETPPEPVPSSEPAEDYPQTDPGDEQEGDTADEVVEPEGDGA